MEDISELPPQHRVSIWEVIAIIAGAILIIVAGLAGLGVKALGNAFDPQRAEAIARSLMTYEISGGSKGLLGANIGGGKVAIVTSTATVASTAAPNPAIRSPEVELFLAQIPLEESDPTSDNELPPQPENPLFSGFSFSYSDPIAFQVHTAQTEQKSFCGATVPVTIQQGTVMTAEGAAPLPGIKYEIKQVLNTKSRIVVISALGDRAAPEAAKVFDSLACK